MILMRPSSLKIIEEHKKYTKYELPENNEKIKKAPRGFMWDDEM